MEAMRLSLIEHEEQQRKQKEEEEKKKREAGGSTTPNASAESTGSVTTTPTPAPVASPTLLSPSSPNSDNTSRQRSSSSLSRNSQDQGRRSPSPRVMGALETALRSATTAVHAVATPPNEREDQGQTQPQAVVPPSPAPTSTVSVPQIVHPEDAAVGSPAGSTVETIVPSLASLTLDAPAANADEPSSSAPPAGEVSTPTQAAPPVQHIPAVRSTSFSSSVLSTEDTQNRETYDYLPSSPSSSTSSLVQQHPSLGAESSTVLQGDSNGDT